MKSFLDQKIYAASKCINTIKAIQFIKQKCTKIDLIGLHLVYWNCLKCGKKTLENIKHTCGHYDSFFIQVRCHHFITLGEAVQNGSKSTNLYGAEKYLQTVRK